ncbi:MAG: hypothetical protein SFU84_00390 [Gemmatimonadales bacterium]|nr:hypothetical protein [Gemmatimonadales bacterium]
MTSLRARSACFIVLLLLSRPDSATAQATSHAGHGLGTVNFPASCSGPARAEINSGVALLHHMTYPQAQAAFQRAASLDPTCAIAHWGIAMTLFQPLWPTRPDLAARQRGWDAVQHAKSLGLPTARERALVAAAEAFFLEPQSPDYWLRIRRWEASMQRAHAALPNDPDVATLYALAHLATTPSDSISRSHPDRAASILLRVYQRHPDHPGAMHYLVHANDVPGRERQLVAITRKYDSLAPSNPHALHMPTHIYVRLGEWDGVIRGNRLAADAALLHPAGDLVWDEFPHAIEYLVYAHLQQGDDVRAAAEVQRLHGTARLQPTFKTAFHLASTAARYALEREAWEDAARILPGEPASLGWERFPWPEAVAHFARGLGAAHMGQPTDAAAAVVRLAQLRAKTEGAGEMLFARNIGVLQLELSAWLAHLDGRSASSVALMQAAEALEASTPKHAVTPGPTLPAGELLGNLFMDLQRPRDALAAYTRVLVQYPRRFNSLRGSARAAAALGEGVLARRHYQQLLELGQHGTRHAALAEAREYLAPR